MKNSMTILVAIIIVSLIMASCGQNSSSKKELELKEKELALKEKELALKEKSDSLAQKITQAPKNQTSNPKSNTVNENQDDNNYKTDFLGCWLWGDNITDGNAILKVKQNGVLIIHRIDLDQDQTAGYKIKGTKIVFTNQHLLMQTNYHIEKIQNKLYLVEECPKDPNKFKKVDCNSEKSKTPSSYDNLCGLWKAKGIKNNNSGETDVNFIKISKKGNDKLMFKKGYYSIQNNNKDNKSEKDISWENDNDVYIKMSNDKFEGKFRVWQGSASDAYYDTKFSIELKDNKTIYYRSTSKDGAGNISNEQLEAFKIK